MLVANEAIPRADLWCLEPSAGAQVGPLESEVKARGTAQSQGFQKTGDCDLKSALHARQRGLRDFEKLKHVNAPKQLMVHALRFNLFLLTCCWPPPPTQWIAGLLRRTQPAGMANRNYFFLFLNKIMTLVFFLYSYTLSYYNRTESLTYELT